MAKTMPKFQRSAKPAAPVRSSGKKFCITQLKKDGNCGKKILLYGRTGMGKSSLAAMAPRPAFICPDKGLDDLDHPTGGEFNVVPGIDTFQDIRDATRDIGVWSDHDTVVYDTLTYIQNSPCVEHVVDNIKKEKGGKAKSITDFSYGKGYEHAYNQLLLLQKDMDALVEAGKNVIVLCQLAQTVKTDSTHGEYWYAHPDLYDKKNAPVVASWVAWASYIFKIDWAQVEIEEGKIGVSSDQHAVFTKPEFSFEAKTRGSVFDECPIVTFDHKADNTIWETLFNE